jgi:hypothetical protein
MQASDLSALHGTVRSRVNALGAEHLGRSSLNGAQFQNGLVLATGRLESTTTETISAHPTPFVQTSANALTWDEPASLIYTPNVLIPRPFLLISSVTLRIDGYGSITTPDDPMMWFTLRHIIDGADDIDPAYFRFIQGQALRYADGSGSWPTFQPPLQGHLVTIQRRKLYTGIGTVQLDQFSVLACAPDYRAGPPSWEIESGVVSFTALHYPG